MKLRHPTRLIEAFFYWLGSKIGRHPRRVILITLALTGLMGAGLINFRETNNVRSEYSPTRAPSQTEYNVAKNFLQQNGTLDPCYIMTLARDGGSLLRDEYRWLLYDLIQALQTEVVVYKEETNAQHKRRAIRFADLCEPYCELNKAFLLFLKLYDPNYPTTLTYPSIYIFNTPAFIGNNVYGIQLQEGTDILESFTTAVMPFYLVASYEDTDAMIEWQHAAIRLFEQPKYSTLLKTGMTGDSLVSYEVRRMGLETAPLIIGSIAAMIVFVFVTSFRATAIQSKPWEALIGCGVPLLAMVAAMGLMSACGLKFQSIVVAAIFLVLSVGVDDIFILSRAWHRSPISATLSDRMAVTLEDAGPSITISALTNVMSFAIGAMSDTPAVRTFCIFSEVAITICFIYQLVFLSAIFVYLSERRELRSYQSLLCCFRADPQDRNRFMEYGERLHDAIVRWWADVITRWSTRLVLCLIMIAYFVISWTGIHQLQSNISIDKMALPDSYLHDFQESFEMALRSMQPITVFVMNPGDLRQPEELKRLKQLVHDYEHSLNAYGEASTFFWLRQYEEFLRFYVEFAEDSDTEPADLSPDAESPPFSYEQIPAFLNSSSYYYFSSFVHTNKSACKANRPECITGFFFVTNFHGVIKYHELVPTVLDWRRIAANYTDLQVYAYSDHTPFVDQTLSIDQTIIGSVAAALICTAVICFIFIPHFMSIMAAVFSVFSISWGIFGLLELWGVDLDPLSMAALLMAIGFSVDFTAHISYHYYKAPYGSPRRRIQNALGIIGWPMVQVGLSTIVALLPMLFKRSYLAMVFLKTIVVVVLLGMFHGLVVLPAILTLFAPDSSRTHPSESKKNLKHSSAYSRGSLSGALSTSDGGEADSSSGKSSVGDSEFEKSTNNWVEQKESFYKTQNLIRNNSSGWLSMNRSLFGNQKPLGTGGKSLKRSRSSNAVNIGKVVMRSRSRRCQIGTAPKRLNVAELAAITPANNPTIIGGPTTAFVHKIALGRSASNAL